ncbi:MAG: DeoR/GlpR transcriptional regulator [Curvibacter sp.]|nr:DeoR/GlpR transcriptional regulator [Curvibacter sp.]
MSQNARRRHEALVNAVLSGIRDTEALSEKLGVSVITIRRDLTQLAEQGRLVRTFGGAAPVGGAEPELNPTQRRFLHKARKEAIARAAAEQVRAGETLLLDGGTTTAVLAQHLRGRQDLRVITNSLQVWTTLANEPGIELIILGGHVRSVSWATSGPLGEWSLRRLSADRVFLGADGVVAGRGLCEASLEQIQLKELMMAQAGQVHIVVDSSKLGRSAQQAWAPLDRPWMLITDSEADEAQLEPFRQLREVEVVVAPVTP